mmetsp:Transcript_21327/g.30542  ORF Transcript_21327/g.30542 Transcript_21327/m.30542 type:complete len:467 (-) Transcript_21327:2243-3643(-)
MVQSKAATLAGVCGNILEWYDFSLFGYFSDVVGEVFFAPSDKATVSSAGEYYDDNLLKSFAVYGGAFLMRPFGGIMIGYMADKYGRKYALVLSLFLMAIPTFIMGLLPTYEQVGSLSTVLLVLCRLLQGMSVGGQLPASLVYTVEMKDRKHWGYYGSLVMAAANVGTLLGNLVGAFLRTILTNEQLYSWGWRIPFLSGILIAFVAVFLKIYGEEHHPNEGEYDQEESQESLGQSKHPLREALRKENRPALISATLTPMLWGAGFYVSFVWMAIFMQDLLDPAIPNAFWINALAMLFGVTIPLPFTGMLSDYCGRMRTMVVGAVGVGVLGPFCLSVITQGQPVRAFFAQFLVGIMLAFYGGPISAWLVERFPVKVRATSLSLGYDIAHCTASAFSPLLATYLVQRVSPVAPGVIYPLFAVLGLVGIFMSTKIHQDGGLEVEDSMSSPTTEMADATEDDEEETEREII